MHLGLAFSNMAEQLVRRSLGEGGFAESATLEKEIKKNLAALGYEL